MTLPNQAVNELLDHACTGSRDFSQFGRIAVKERGKLVLLNYTAEAQYAGDWTPHELVCRGLILSTSPKEVVARPFDKFFNWGEGGRTTDAHLVRVREKVDGSLGISYVDMETSRIRLATRGSFDSKQAGVGTRLLHDKYRCGPVDSLVAFEWTYLFEIVYPENRIICDYGNREELVLLAARLNCDGEYMSEGGLDRIAKEKGFRRPKAQTAAAVHDLLKAKSSLPATNEGYVAEFADGQRFKFKGDAYFQIAKTLQGMTKKRVLESIESGTFSEVIECVPDELLGQVREWREELLSEYVRIQIDSDRAWASSPRNADRRDFAAFANTQDSLIRPVLFARLDGKRTSPVIFKSVRRSLSL